ncbi:MAG: electron transfer flavoprotein subunit alpha/FixB family protein, partial [Nocardioidaceae bacterium]
VLVLVETDAHEVTETSLETLTFARDLAARRGGVALHAAVVGSLPDDLRRTVLDQLGDQGVAVVHHAQHDELTAYTAAGWAASVTTAVGASSADVVLAAGTPRGSEVMAHVATRLDATMAAQVVAVREADPLVVARQVMGGSVLELMQVPGAPAVVTVAGHAVDISAAEQPTTPEVRDLQPELTAADLVCQVRRVEATESDDTAALTGARVVVGAGRGAGSADGFSELLELTEQLDGALGVSRVVTSLGWRPHAEQVGQTGSRISPEVYIACGISGAIQHWAGCSSAKTIIAINTDADAPMVTKAHYAVIGDLHEVVPAISEELRRRRS